MLLFVLYVHIYLMTFQIYVSLKVAAVMAPSLISIHFISYIMFVK